MISVVFAWSGTLADLRSTMDDVVPHATRVSAEVVVAGHVDSAASDSLVAWLPGAVFVNLAPGTPRGEVRRLGYEAASGDVVILIDESTPDPAERVRAIAERSHRIAASATASPLSDADE